MKLYFLRHGRADWPDWQGADDDRPLTKAGRREVRAVAQLLVRLKAAPDLILTSPLPRAEQTAAIAARCLEVKCREAKLLKPGFDGAALKRLQQKHAGKSLLLVGHEEDFSRVIASLTNARIKLVKAGVRLCPAGNARARTVALAFPAEVFPDARIRSKPARPAATASSGSHATRKFTELAMKHFVWAL